MARATTSLEDMLARHPDYAMPHAILDGEQRRIPVRPIYARPAGSICASIAEMAAWMRFHLDPVPGRDGLRLSPAAATELTAPQIYLGPSDFPEIGPVHYGFGFFVGHYRGARSVDHPGGRWCGYNCDLRLLPERGSGVMVLRNGHDPGCTPLTNTILDHLLELEPLPLPGCESREAGSSIQGSLGTGRNAPP
jgi:Beta-lactamase